MKGTITKQNGKLKVTINSVNINGAAIDINYTIDNGILHITAELLPVGFNWGDSSISTAIHPDLVLPEYKHLHKHWFTRKKTLRTNIGWVILKGDNEKLDITTSDFEIIIIK